MRSVIDVPSLRGGLRLESLREAERGDRGDRERERALGGQIRTRRPPDAPLRTSFPQLQPRLCQPDMTTLITEEKSRYFD